MNVKERPILFSGEMVKPSPPGGGLLLQVIPPPRIPGLHEGRGKGLAVLEGCLLSWKGLFGADTLGVDAVDMVNFQDQARTECGVSEGVQTRRVG